MYLLFFSFHTSVIAHLLPPQYFIESLTLAFLAHNLGCLYTSIRISLPSLSKSCMSPGVTCKVCSRLRTSSAAYTFLSKSLQDRYDLPHFLQRIINPALFISRYRLMSQISRHRTFNITLSQAFPHNFRASNSLYYPFTCITLKIPLRLILPLISGPLTIPALWVYLYAQGSTEYSHCLPSSASHDSLSVFLPSTPPFQKL